MIGETQRRISSTAPGSRSGWARSFSHSSRRSWKASNPPLIALRVVSLPASTKSSQFGEDHLVRRRLAVELAVDELAHQVVPGPAAALFDQAFEVDVQLARARDWRSGRPSRRRAGTRGRWRRSPRSSSDTAAPSRRAARRGSRTITAMGSGAAMRSTKSHSLVVAPGRRPVEDLGGDPLDVGAVRLYRARRESRARELAHGSVTRRVEHDDHLRPDRHERLIPPGPG